MLPLDEAERLADYCLERAGDQVRGVVAYTSEAVDTVYVRSDLEETYSDEQLAHVNEVGQQIHRIRTERSMAETPLGTPGPGVRIYANAVVVQLPVGETRGVLATFEPEAAGSLLGFIRECQREVRDA